MLWGFGHDGCIVIAVAGELASLVVHEREQLIDESGLVLDRPKEMRLLEVRQSLFISELALEMLDLALLRGLRIETLVDDPECRLPHPRAHLPLAMHDLGLDMWIKDLSLERVS